MMSYSTKPIECVVDFCWCDDSIPGEELWKGGQTCQIFAALLGKYFLATKFYRTFAQNGTIAAKTKQTCDKNEAGNI